MKRILYFMPDNPVTGKSGNRTRCLRILEYLSQLNRNEYIVDFLSISDWGDWGEQDLLAFKKRFPAIHVKTLERKMSKKKPIRRFFYYKIPFLLNTLFRGVSVDITTPYFRRKAANYLNASKHDVIIASYASWGRLFVNLKHRPYLILDTHDFITAQNKRNANKIGKLFQSELDIIRNFNEIWTLSVEEKYIYEQFTNSKIVYHPVAFKNTALQQHNRYKYDIIYVASHNPHNILSIHWFLENVFPKIQQYKLHIIGSICNEIPLEHPNVIKYGILEDLADVYNNARISICPMLSGTGVKIKVIESLSYNVPVVANTRGVDGLINKSKNGCFSTDDKNEFAGYIHQLMIDDELYMNARKEANTYFNSNHDIAKEELYFKTFLSQFKIQ
jgi:glycosyltransferase involved in cell wall biosynthesis